MKRQATRILGSFVAASALGLYAAAQEVHSVRIEAGELVVDFQDNSQSPEILSGVQSLFNTRYAKSFDAFDPEGRGSSAGLNFEHITSGHAAEANKFSPRHGRYSLYPLEDGRSVSLERDEKDSPWAVSSSFRLTVTEPHSIDAEFRCTVGDPSRFGERGYAALFFANYMNDVDDAAIHFRGITEPGGQEKWISADAPKTHVDWNGGGTYRHMSAADLEYDNDHNFNLNLWSYDYPRFSKPFYYGRASNGMVYMLMFDRGFTEHDEIRFSLFKFKLLRERQEDRRQRPAWDFQYVIQDVAKRREYGFRMRAVWKNFVSAEDCLQEYERWAASLPR